MIKRTLSFQSLFVLRLKQNNCRKCPWYYCTMEWACYGLFQSRTGDNGFFQGLFQSFPHRRFYISKCVLHLGVALRVKLTLTNSKIWEMAGLSTSEKHLKEKCVWIGHTQSLRKLKHVYYESRLLLSTFLVWWLALFVSFYEWWDSTPHPLVHHLLETHEIHN